MRLARRSRSGGAGHTARRSINSSQSNMALPA